MTMTTCSRCGASSAGNFCSQCGAVLSARPCANCAAPVPPGARFCTRCGVPVAGGAGAEPAGPAERARARSGGGGDGPHPAWWFAAGLLVLLILVVAWPILRPADSVPPAALQGAGASGGAAAIDLSAMTPREAADALFDRVMRAAAGGDSAQVAQFVVMAVNAYHGARPLDSDGHFHLASMQHLAGDFAGALETVEEGLLEAPGHLLLLYAGGQAATEVGDLAAARHYYEELLREYDAGIAQRHPDYEAHRELMPTVRAEAVAWLAAAGEGAD